MVTKRILGGALAAVLAMNLAVTARADSCHDAACTSAAAHNAVARAVPKPLQSLVSLGVASIVRMFPAPDGLQGYELLALVVVQFMDEDREFAKALAAQGRAMPLQPSHGILRGAGQENSTTQENQ